jgi:hypothetical protein
MPKRESVLTPIVDVPILLTRQQAAELANVSTDCLDNWSHRPNFPVIRPRRSRPTRGLRYLSPRQNLREPAD